MSHSVNNSPIFHSQKAESAKEKLRFAGLETAEQINEIGPDVINNPRAKDQAAKTAKLNGRAASTPNAVSPTSAFVAFNSPMGARFETKQTVKIVADKFINTSLDFKVERPTNFKVTSMDDNGIIYGQFKKCLPKNSTPPNLVPHN